MIASCLICGQAPVIVSGRATTENVDNVKVSCPYCGRIYNREEILKLLARYGR